MRDFLKTFFILIIVGLIRICSASEDLDFMIQQIKDNHPGIYNSKDPGFNNHLSCTYAKVKSELAQNRAKSEIQNILTKFAQSFQDRHLYLNWYKNQKILKKNVLPLRHRFLTSDIIWIDLPSFNLSQAQERDYQILLKKIPEWKHLKAIVFDLRGNTGGNSDYGSKIVDALYGSKYTQQQRDKLPPTKVDWRVSPDNLKHIRCLYDRYHESWMFETIQGMEKALQNNQPYYTKNNADFKSAQTMIQTAHNVSAKVMIIVDNDNVSAALDFLDDIKLMDSSALLIGQTTKADRFYMETRSVELPSGWGCFWFPIKVYHGRLRGDNVPYIPDIKYATDNTRNLEKLIRRIILNQT